MKFNRTIVDESEVLAACLGPLYPGDGQVVRSLTRNVAQMAGGEERLISYLGESLSLNEETLTDGTGSAKRSRSRTARSGSPGLVSTRE